MEFIQREKFIMTESEANADLPDKGLIMKAIEYSLKGLEPVLCDSCCQPIIIERDNNQQLKSSSCKCGRYDTSFRGV